MDDGHDRRKLSLGALEITADEFDFTVKYHKGPENTVADCVSRLHTFHESSWTPDLDISCYLVVQEPEYFLKLETFNVGEDQPRTAKRKAELRDDPDLEDFEESSRILAAEPELSAITPEELLRAQSVDFYQPPDFYRYTFALRRRGVTPLSHQQPGTADKVITLG